MGKKLQVFLLLQLAIMTILASVVFEDCGSVYELYAVNIAGCGSRLPCYITLGEDVLVRLEFHADFLSRKLDQDVVIKINHINLKTPVTPELCEIVDCPVSTKYVTSFTSIMTVPTNMALNQRGYLRWRIYNENEVLVLCYSVLVQTQSPIQKFLFQK
ncbi:NPC intracellular cholesterol transporter 2 isoform X1 [Manduca sexta]|uniref:NPC intracellular cholesterol transporter 2 isoform X1 n=1 Tax=Manduca sexta TaxID=7130 RepID=UPI001181F824|nr:NPC intracellular cholesterol transporter 2 isoform X1 [Manduca sexta]